MSAPSLRTQCPCVGFSCLFFPNRQLSTVGCELALPLNSPPAILTSPVTPKSFIRNAYKKHGGWDEKARLTPCPLFLCVLCVSLLESHLLALRAVDCLVSTVGFHFRLSLSLSRVPLTLSPLSATLTKNTGVRVCPPTSALHSPLPPSIFSFQLSTPVNPPGLTSRGTRIITEHRSRITAP